MSFTLTCENLRNLFGRIFGLRASDGDRRADAHTDAGAQSERFAGGGDNCADF